METLLLTYDMIYTLFQLLKKGFDLKKFFEAIWDFDLEKKYWTKSQLLTSEM